MIIFTIFLVFLIIFIALGILPIQKEVANILFEKPQSQKNNEISIYSNSNSNIESKTINNEEKTNDLNNKKKRQERVKLKKAQN